jgi:hypothetical protein
MPQGVFFCFFFFYIRLEFSILKIVWKLGFGVWIFSPNSSDTIAKAISAKVKLCQSPRQSRGFTGELTGLALRQYFYFQNSYPVFHSQSVNACEMPEVSGNKGHIVRDRHCGNLQIREGACDSPCLQRMPQPAAGIG